MLHSKGQRHEWFRIAECNCLKFRPSLVQVTKYMEEKLEARDRMIDKLKLKNGNLKAAVAAAEGEVRMCLGACVCACFLSFLNGEYRWTYYRCFEVGVSPVSQPFDFYNVLIALLLGGLLSVPFPYHRISCFTTVYPHTILTLLLLDFLNISLFFAFLFYYQLKAKEEAGDALHYIDFHQHQIENKQHNAKLLALTNEVLSMKATSSQAAASLNAAKQQLAELVASTQSATTEANLRSTLLDKLGQDIERMVAAVAAEKRTMKRLAQNEAAAGGGLGGGAGGAAGDAGMPQVLDYVAQKAEMFDLEAVLKTWTKKVDIMEMAAKRVRILQQTQAAGR